MKVARFLNVDAIRVTSLEAYVHCPKRWSAEVSGKVTRSPGIYARIGTAVHTMIEHYITGHRDLNLKRTSSIHSPVDDVFAYLKNEGVNEVETQNLLNYLNTLTQYLPCQKAVEQEVLFELLPEALPIRGHMDVIFKLSDTEALIVDHKTNRRFESVDIWSRKLQPRLYAYAANKLFGFEKVYFRIGYVNLNMLVEWETKPEEDEKFLKEYYQYVWNDLVNSTANDKWTERVHDGCGYCLLRDKCNMFNNQLSGWREGFERIINVQTLAEKYTWIQNVRKAAERVEAELKKEVIQKIESGESVQTNEHQFLLQQKSTRKVNSEAFTELLMNNEISTEDFNSAISVKVTEIDKIIKRKPELAQWAQSGAITPVPNENPTVVIKPLTAVAAIKNDNEERDFLAIANSMQDVNDRT